jgi:hypothetical protein
LRKKTGASALGCFIIVNIFMWQPPEGILEIAFEQSDQPGSDLDLGGQRPVDGTALCNIPWPGALLSSSSGAGSAVLLRRSDW